MRLYDEAITAMIALEFGATDQGLIEDRLNDIRILIQGKIKIRPDDYPNVEIVFSNTLAPTPGEAVQALR